ncbi:MAG: ferrous iron transport protein B, partial [Blautia sp.]|nr:ferrous iron transport protein B [Blautia sp.]
MSIKIALAGNLNCGKTTLFNALTGSNQYVGNWPGVTVEKKEGKWKEDPEVVIQDLPGIYSLSPYTLEEVVSREYLVTQRPDAILNIIDGTNLERNLYLTTQLMELGIPVVVAVNMMDLVRKNNDQLDIRALSKKLGCDVVEISALKGEGIAESARRAVDAAKAARGFKAPAFFDGSLQAALDKIQRQISGKVDASLAGWYAVKLFERDEKVVKELSLSSSESEAMEAAIAQVEQEMDDDAESIVTNARYQFITGVTKDSLIKGKARHELSTSDKIDRIVTNRVLGIPIFFCIMFAVYALSMGGWKVSFGTMATDFTNDVIFGEWVPALFDSLLGFLHVSESSVLYGLVQNGIVAGVGAVLGFVPQMLVLFLCLSILEDIGYMARVAFVMDRIFRQFGLSGKSFIPMMVA